MNVYEPSPIFKDRADAGRRLAVELMPYKDKNTVVFAIPRGGIPVAIEVASGLKAPLDIVIVRKIPIPYQTEAGFGAITEDGTIVLNEPLLKRLNLSRTIIDEQADEVRNEILRRSLVYRRKLPPSPVKGRAAIIIDDGLASGYTMIAAIRSLRKRKAAEVVVAVPVASADAFNLVEPMADSLICLEVSHSGWFAVASFYRDWYDLNDEEVNRYLEIWRLKKTAV